MQGPQAEASLPGTNGPALPPPRLEAGSWGGGRALRAPGWAPTTAGRRSGEPPVGGPSVAPRAMELRPGPCAVVVAVVSGDLGARPGALLGLGPCSGGRGRASPPSDLVSGSTGAEPFRREETPAQGPGRCGGGGPQAEREHGLPTLPKAWWGGAAGFLSWWKGNMCWGCQELSSQPLPSLVCAGEGSQSPPPPRTRQVGCPEGRSWGL